MEPEETFLENAATMVKYGKMELQQFLEWTDCRKPYGIRAKALVKRLEELAAEMKMLQKEYKAR
ncbi:hypothetical protein [Hymenobacter crusticola]|uniref:Uncharacterized protein n=1 Tax=Hymenobacter crusticola TaxID=1770526 RepID=A0A243WJ13_9BACT|nr:hypothetical protein [Hymenobacter crusticola]OUJ75888.1 hypothetical protein BXP70_00920 [Hymenobacter crusticola]